MRSETLKTCGDWCRQCQDRDLNHKSLVDLADRPHMLSLTAKRSVYRASSRAFYALRFNSTKSQDPFPLPLSRELGEQIAQDYDGPRPEPRQETVETLRARLTYQSRKRGTLECDLLLSTFASENLNTMSEAELREYRDRRL